MTLRSGLLFRSHFSALSISTETLQLGSRSSSRWVCSSRFSLTVVQVSGGSSRLASHVLENSLVKVRVVIGGSEQDIPCVLVRRVKGSTVIRCNPTPRMAVRS